MSDEQKINLKIDGVEVQAKPGETVIEAAREAGIYIPYLCWHPILKPYGACRMCIVETVGGRGMPASCHTTVAEGMDVITNSDAIEEVRRDILALTLSSHPHGCLTCWRIEHCGPTDVCLRNVRVTDRCVVCPQNERCELQDVTYSIKLDEVPLPYQYRELPLETRNPFIDHDMNLCIVCGKCVRACDELEGASAITFEERGNDTIVGTALGGTLAESGCTFCGLCVDVCPVGAITEKDSKWAGRADQFVTSACSQCSVGCSLQLNVSGDKLTRITHDIEGAANRGQECVQGKFGHKWIYSKERLKRPMLRRNGTLEETTWEVALDAVAQGLAKYQPEEIAVLGSAKVTNEDNYVLQKFARAVLGTPNIDFVDPLCPPSALAALDRAFGSTAATGILWQIRDARAVLVVDSDLTFEHPVAGLQVKEAVRRGAHLIVLDPRDTEMGLEASEKMVCRPGSEVAVLGAMMKAILDEGLEDKAFIEQRTQELDVLRESLGAFTLEAAQRASGVPKEQMIQAARLLSTQNPGVILFSPSITGEGEELGAALANLALLTGGVGRPSSGLFPLRGENNSQGAEDMGCRPDRLPGGAAIDSAASLLRARELWGEKTAPKPGLDYAGVLEATGQGKIKAMIILGENQVLPDTDGALAQALSELDFLVVQEAFLRNLESHAHVALPAASFAERDGTYTSIERRVQRVRRAIAPVGDSRPAWQWISAVARRMGSSSFGHEGASQIMDEIARMAPTYAGVSYARLETESLQWPCTGADHPGTPILHETQFLRGIGRFLPMPFPSEPMATKGLTAFTAVLREIKGTVDLAGSPQVEVNSQDARGIGLRDGDRVKVASAFGEVAATARVNGRAPAGSVLLSVPHVKMVTDIWNSPTPGALTAFSRAKRFPVTIEKAS